jgi:hypothetical protein
MPQVASFLDLQQIIPLPEAKDFQIQQRQKGAATTAARSGRDYTRYDVAVAGQERTAFSKQSAVKFAIQGLFRAGVDLTQIKAASWERRWIAVHPADGEAMDAAFRREYPDRSPTNLWFDLGITQDGETWVIQQFGRMSTEPALARLAGIAAPHTDLQWAPSDVSEDEPRASLIKNES